MADKKAPWDQRRGEPVRAYFDGLREKGEPAILYTWRNQMRSSETTRTQAASATASDRTSWRKALRQRKSDAINRTRAHQSRGSPTPCTGGTAPALQLAGTTDRARWYHHGPSLFSSIAPYSLAPGGNLREKTNAKFGNDQNHKLLPPWPATRKQLAEGLATTQERRDQ
jgi:hypothetical protein